MTIQKIWPPRAAGKKGFYAGRTLGGILGIVALMVILIFGGVFLPSFAGLPREVFSLALCLGVTALGVGLSLRLGRRTVCDGTAFILTTEGRLYGLAVSDFAWFGGGVLSYASGVLETQRLLQKMAQRPFLPAGAEEILAVDKIRQARREYVIRCKVCRSGGKPTGKTFFLSTDLEDVDQLLFELERRQSGENMLEYTQSPNTLGILVSGVILAGFSALCVLSHPAQGKLPQEIYYPCLLAAFVAFCALVAFLIRRSRGE